MPVFSAGAMATARAAASVGAARRPCTRCISATGCKDREFLPQLRRAAARTFGSFPIAGTDQDFAISLALLAMKLVNRHDMKGNGAGVEFKD
jgi:hypothetical protein